MSERSVNDFLQRISADDAYRRVLEQAVTGSGDAVAATIARAAKDGYGFTKAELEAAVRAAQGQAAELGDAQLAQVAGGFNPQPTPPAMTQPTDTYIRNLLSGKQILRY